MAGSAAPPVLMTVSGPLQPGEVRPEGPALCREWLVNDQSALVKPPERWSSGGGAVGDDACVRAGDRVDLSNVLAMRRWPLAALNNLHLSSDDAVQELCGPLRLRHKAASLVVACPPRAYWAAATPAEWGSLLQALSAKAGVPVVAGAAPAPGQPASEARLEAEVARLVTELAVGYEVPAAGGADESTRVRPGLLGEFPLWQPSDGPPPAHQMLALRACVAAQRRSGAPMLLSGPVTREAAEVLESGGGPPTEGACLWERCAFFDVPHDSPVPAVELAARGAFLGFCPPGGAADVAWQPHPCRGPWRTEDAFLRAVSRGPPGRTLVGSGMRFRTDLTSCGGAGIAHVLDLTAAAAAGCPIIPEATFQVPGVDALRAAAVAFLQYPWQPPLPPEKVVHMVRCHWCGTEKKEGEHFSKLGFTYCSPKCIAKHRQVDFAADKREQG